MLKVIKRNGNVEDFNLDKIKMAIEKAMLSVNELDENLSAKVSKDVFEEIREKELISIEEIQDEVENALIKNNLNSIAKEYILYRNERKRIRDEQSNLYVSSQKVIDEIMNMKNIENANANVDEGSFSGKNAKVQGYFLKQWALNNIIDKEVSKAHEEGLLYIHDLDNYASGLHNCLFIDFEDLFSNNGGFETRNGDVREPNDIMTFFQLVAVTFQCQSQVQFGGVGSNKIDYDGAKYVGITFKKCFKDALIDCGNYSEEIADTMIRLIGEDCRLENEELMEVFPHEYKVAEKHTIKKTKQGAESLYHNLNTLESRAGSQVPFTSINFGTDTSPEGRLISKCLLEASINGIGKYHKTSIFPISIFKYKKGVNDKEGTPNYDLYQLALKSLSKRIYPNIVNVDVDYIPKTDDPDCENATMGCRTALGYDVNGLGWHKGGRGNIAPTTMNLVKLGIEYGICQGKRIVADLEGFFKAFEELLLLAEKSLIDRYEWIANKPSKSGFFMYRNGTMKNNLGRKLEPNESVRECLKHGTLAIGYIGIAECMKALFGKDHSQDEEVYKFAYLLVKRINQFAKQATERHQLNFSAYATPAESTCMTLRNKLYNQYGLLEGITDREYLTNSHHIPVYNEMSIFKKIDLEAPFSKLATGGYIMYTELESSVSNNLEALEKIINYAMDKGVAYFALNFPIDTCKECGFSAEINDNCPKCGSDKIERLRRVTGYLTTDYSNFNKGKIAEVEDRVKHSKFMEK